MPFGLASLLNDASRFRPFSGHRRLHWNLALLREQLNSVPTTLPSLLICLAGRWKRQLPSVHPFEAFLSFRTYPQTYQIAPGLWPGRPTLRYKTGIGGGGLYTWTVASEAGGTHLFGTVASLILRAYTPDPPKRIPVFYMN